MRKKTLEYMNKNQLVEIIYMSYDGTMTKRHVKVYKVDEQYFRGYCFLRGSVRTFKYNHVLALVPLINRESMVV